MIINSKNISKFLTLKLALLLASSALSSVYSEKPLHTTSFKEILNSYTFVNDFSMQPPEREVSDEIFWKYPIAIPPLEFDIEDEIAGSEVPATKGFGVAVTHLNRGRMFFLKGDYEKAKANWLSARARFGKNFVYHRRNDYFIGLAFMNIARKEWLDHKKNWWHEDVKNRYSNATSFLSWALISKADNPDPLVDKYMPKELYNLASIYWRFKGYSAAYGAARKGLEFLRRTGRKEYRAQFNRFLAEAYIKNRTYLEAVQYIDKAIRQDPDPKLAAAMFTRVGDIYYDLNNYELAEDAYALGARIDFEFENITPYQMVLRGESLFWLGKFSEAQKVLNYALEGSALRKETSPLGRNMAAYATLRVADAYLARGKYKDARLAYFNVMHEFKRTGAATIAGIRSACLELPFYAGKNVGHARKLLEKMKLSDSMPRVAREISWACQVGSYTQRERTAGMLKRVTSFANSYPESRFLKSMATPVKEVQASKIEELFKKGEQYKALSFFEKNRKLLFSKIDDKLGHSLLVTYADLHLSKKAAEFWKFRKKEDLSDKEIIRQAVLATELYELTAESKWKNVSRKISGILANREWKIKPATLARSFVQRVQATQSVNDHLTWIYALTKHWASTNQDYICSHQYSVLSKIQDRSLKEPASVRKEIDAMVAKTMPGLLRLDESCAISLLDLEAMLYKDDVLKLASIYETRKSWPLLGAFLKSYWTISEKLKQKGHNKVARRLWSTIKSRGPKGSPEVGFAIARLDPRKTEFEKLWD